MVQSRYVGAGEVGCAARHARQRRSHLSRHTEHDDVSRQAGERLHERVRWLAQEIVELVDGLNRVRDTQPGILGGGRPVHHNLAAGDRDA